MGKRKKSGPIIGLGIFLLFCFALSFYFFINSAFFNVKKVEVSGCQTVSEEQVIELSGLTVGTNLLKIDAKGAISKIVMHPVIKKVQVSRKIPHTLELKVTERTPVALVVGNDGYLAVDIEGIYLKQVDDLLNLHLPVVSGLSIEERASPGADLTTAGLQAALQLIEVMDQTFLENVAEIKASSPYTLTLKMLQGVEIRFGEPEEIERKLQLIQELLIENGEVINDETVEYIDLRYNSLPVIKRKN